MLTGKMVRVRYTRDRILPYYLDEQEEASRLLAEQMIELFRARKAGHAASWKRIWKRRSATRPARSFTRDWRSC